MALSPEEKASRLFKKSLGKGETLLTRDFFEEPIVGNDIVIPSQIWAQASEIPATAPTLTNGQIDGVVQYFEKLSLTAVPGSSVQAFQHSTLVDAISFTFGVSYNYKLYTSLDVVIPDGQGDWLVDPSTGIVMFYGTLPAGVSSSTPPQISFYKYVGEKGMTSGATSGLVIKDSVILATTSGDTLSNYSPSLSGYTVLPDVVDTISGSTFVEGDRILVKDQVDLVQNGIFQVSGTTLVRALDSDGQPTGEVGINDYVFVTSGVTNLASSWVLADTNAADVDNITPGQDTQEWVLFARSAAYSADGLALKLDGQVFKVDLDDSTIYGSGLYQSPDGLRISNELVSLLSGSTTGLTSLSTALSTEISTSSSGITSLSTAISTEISDRISGDTSIIEVINNLSGVTSQTAGSGLTYDPTEKSLNVNVDNWTIKISGDTLIGAQQWLQFSTASNVIGTSGFTSSQLDLSYNPITPVSAYINGVEYLINTGTASASNRPFYYSAYPPVQGTQIGFDPTEAGFDLISGVDMVLIKYLIVENIMQ